MKHLLLTTIAAVLVVGCGKPDGPLIQAARTGNHEAVKQHLASGADVNATDMIGRTPLHYASMMGHKEVAELLIANGADVNAKDDVLEFTPLHLTAEYGHKEIAESLIAKGADVNEKQYWLGNTPLDWAIEENHTELANLLRKHGGKTGGELKDEGKQPPTSSATIKRHPNILTGQDFMPARPG